MIHYVEHGTLPSWSNVDFAIMIKCGVWWQWGRDGGKDILGCASSDHYRVGESWTGLGFTLYSAMKKVVSRCIKEQGGNLNVLEKKL